MIGETSRKCVYTKGLSDNKYRYEPRPQNETCEIETRERKKSSEVEQRKRWEGVDQG